MNCADLSVLVIVHVPTLRVARQVPGPAPPSLAVYPDGTASVAVHVVSFLLVNPLTVTLFGFPSDTLRGFPDTVPELHDTLTDTLAELLSEKTLDTANCALLRVFVIVQVPAVSVA